MGKQWKQWEILFWEGFKITADGDCTHEIKRHLLLGRKVMANLDNILKSRDYFANKGPSSQGYGFSSDHVWIWESDYKESWAPKNWCFWAVVLEKTLESPVDCKQIQPVHSKGDQSWVFISTSDAETETPILWPPDAKSWLICKDLMLGRIEGGRRRRWQRMRWLDGITDSIMLQWASLVMDNKAWYAAVHGVTESWTWLSDWTEVNHAFSSFSYQKD